MLKIFIFTIALILFSNVANARGVPVFWSWGGEKFYKVADLPDTSTYRYNAKFIDIGVIYKNIEIFFIPIWQYNIRYIGIIPNDDEQYYDFTQKEIQNMAKSENILLPPVSQIKLDFWTAWGGKIIVLLLVVIGIVGSMLAVSKEEPLEDNGK